MATPHLSGYSRDIQFGDWQHNSSLCGYGTTRDYVLKRDLTNVAMNQYCKVQSGDFADPYTGQSVHFVKGEKTSTLVQIDHIVAVQDAWASGLWQASRAGERISYYNDPDVLQAADQTSNEAKGAGSTGMRQATRYGCPRTRPGIATTWPNEPTSNTSTSSP